MFSQVLADRPAPWKAACLLRWHGRAKDTSWRSTVSKGQWKTAYKRAEEEIVANFPVFCMRGAVQMGMPMSMHFFEPRYKQMVRVASQHPDQRFRDKFAFAACCPVREERTIHSLLPGFKNSFTLIVILMFSCRRKAWWHSYVRYIISF